MPRKANYQKQVHDLAQKSSKAALTVLIDLMTSGKDERIKQAAAARVLDLAIGRPAQQKDTASAATVRLLPGDDQL